MTQVRRTHPLEVRFRRACGSRTDPLKKISQNHAAARFDWTVGFEFGRTPAKFRDVSSRSKDRTPEEILAVDMDRHLMEIELLEPVIEGSYCDVEHFDKKRESSSHG